jgi:ABC-type branched-subunit amino acid transport system substrate-binding protein
MANVKKLKLGWLIPYSGIFRNLRTDLQQGFETALLQLPGISFEVYREYVHSGGTKETEDALKKLLLYEGVDLVIGVVSTKTAINIIPLLESRQTPAFLLNLGADIPNRQLCSDFLFYNSLHLWKSQWAMGKWAQKKYGGEPSIGMSIYEGGYGLHETFRAGTAVSGAASVQLNIVKNFSSQPDTLRLIQNLREQHPTHAHALLSGKEGDQFLQLFREHDLGADMALSVNPFMLDARQPGVIPPGLDLYHASTWSPQLDNPANLSFVRSYRSAYGELPNVFSLLAYETGLVIAAALEDAGKPGRESIAIAAGHLTPAGPRGIIRMSSRTLRTSLPVYIYHSTTASPNSAIENTMLGTDIGIEWNDPMPVAEQAFFTGWQNPYLCV